MSSKPHRQQDALRASFLALSEACPFDHCNPDDCPLFPVRKMKPWNPWYESMKPGRPWGGFNGEMRLFFTISGGNGRWN